MMTFSFDVKFADNSMMICRPCTIICTMIIGWKFMIGCQVGTCWEQIQSARTVYPVSQINLPSGSISPEDNAQPSKPPSRWKNCQLPQPGNRSSHMGPCINLEVHRCNAFLSHCTASFAGLGSSVNKILLSISNLFTLNAGRRLRPWSLSCFKLDRLMDIAFAIHKQLPGDLLTCVWHTGSSPCLRKRWTFTSSCRGLLTSLRLNVSLQAFKLMPQLKPFFRS